MTIEIISRSMSTKVCEWAGIEFAIPGSAVKLATDCVINQVQDFGTHLISEL